MKNLNRTNRSGISVKIILCLAVFALIFGCVVDFVLHKTENKVYPLKYEKYVKKYAAEFGVPESVIFAVIKIESDFDKNAVSKSDPPALGLMQFTSDTFEWVASMLHEFPSSFDVYDPETSIRYGAYLLSFYYTRFENWDVVYAAYNAGYGRIKTWLEDPSIADGKGGLVRENIPFGETRAYVKRVAHAREEYEKLYYTKK